MIDYITDDVKAMIGLESDWVEACDPVETGAVRRFTQALMDTDPIYGDAAAAAATKYGGIVAPPLFALHALRPAFGSPDTLDRFRDDPDYDGSLRGAMQGLPPLPIPLHRVLNGGNEVEVYRLPRAGERIRIRSKYLDIYQKEGKSGPMVFLITETTYANEHGDVLIKSLQTRIIR